MIILPNVTGYRLGQQSRCRFESDELSIAPV